MKRHAFHREGAREYNETLEYYASVDERLADRFYDEIERLILEIRRQPERFPRIGAYARRALAKGFPYSVIYLVEPDRVWIVSVMHSKRRPGYWKSRL